MAVFKCKMCGGDLEIIEGASVAECEFCGTKQTVPKANDENLQNLYNRANTLRIKSEFDKAEKLYEKIIQADDTQAEAYWGLILCKYGIEYVDDPTTFKKIPTCHRASYDSIVADDDYKSALTNADSSQKAIYEAQAKEIDRIQKDILALAQKEESYDVFICYKETDANGQRTQDSVIANDIYYQLTQEGFKVFYAAITLEGKLGSAYEPIIFAALNSAKVMLSIGTKPEYFNAVWVKNEWSRFLKIVKKDRSKLLIPCYKDMDAYELPEEFVHLQAQDMGKIGFINDVVRGIKKVIKKDEPKATVVNETVVSTAAANTAPLLERAFMFLEDGNWESADEYCEKVLDVDPKNAQAYLGKLMVELKLKTQDALQDCANPFQKSNNYQKAVRFGDAKLKAKLEGYIEHICTRNEKKRLEGLYTSAVGQMALARTESDYKKAAEILKSISAYKDASALAQECLEKAEIARKDAIYAEGKTQMNGEAVSKYESAIKLFESISGWKDADQQIAICQKKIEERKAKEEADRLERERKAELACKEAAERAKRIKKIAIITAAAVCTIAVFIFVWNTVIIPGGKYNDAVALMDAGKYYEAIVVFAEIDDYKDSEQKSAECLTAILDGRYDTAIALMKEGKYNEAIKAFKSLSDHRDSVTKIKECEDAIVTEKNEQQYQAAATLGEAGKTYEAALVFGALGDYRDAKTQAKSLWNEIAVRETISAGSQHTVGLKADGTVVAVGSNGSGQCNISGWKDIVAINAGGHHTIGLEADGTVVAVGSNYYGQCNVSGWKDIVAISAGSIHTVGLKADGTVVAIGHNELGQCNVSSWKDIVAISAGGDHTVGLKADGTVVAVGKNNDGQCNVSGWKDIVAISVGGDHTVGLKADGTVVAVGDNSFDQCKVSEWKDIVAISAGESHTVGLKADGTAVADGWIYYGQCSVSEWKDIVAISAGGIHTVGLKADGTVVAAGRNQYGQCDVSGWKNIKVPEKD